MKNRSSRDAMLSKNYTDKSVGVRRSESILDVHTQVGSFSNEKVPFWTCQ